MYWPLSFLPRVIFIASDGDWSFHPKTISPHSKNKFVPSSSISSQVTQRSQLVPSPKDELIADQTSNNNNQTKKSKTTSSR